MKRTFPTLLLLLALLACYADSNGQTGPAEDVAQFPRNGATGVNPDTYLELTFPGAPVLHNSGTIRVYDVANGQLVDELDLSIPPGPRNTRTLSPYDSFRYPSIPDSIYTVARPDNDSTHVYQQDYIGGTSAADVYHFYPVLLRDSVAIICLHHNRLRYHKHYRVEIDSGVFSFPDGRPFVLTGKDRWTFSTKENPPAQGVRNLVVSADGSGDFTTIQGAVDVIPENNAGPFTILIRNGIYEEIVNFRNRQNVTFIGEDWKHTIVSYANNSVFNRHEMSPDPALAGHFHNIRAVLAVYNASDITITNLTLRSLGEKPAQAEGLLVSGQHIIVDHVSIEGSGDALQATGRVYVSHSKIQGAGDNVLGYGAVYFHHCDFVSFGGPHMWVRNTDKNHGNVMVECTFRTLGDREADLARAPDNHGIKYPFAEAVLINCKLQGVKPEGWGKVTDSSEDIHYWEYNSTNLVDGKPVDVSKRHPASRQLTMERDADLIARYNDPSYILGGWKPAMAPLILSEPVSLAVHPGAMATFEISVAAVPDPQYQWYRDGVKLENATGSTLNILNVGEQARGEYWVEAMNSGGKVKSKKVVLEVETK